MHFITGGAFNGKRSWVETTYELKNSNRHRWISAYSNDSLPEALENISEETIVIEGVETWIRNELLYHKNPLNKWDKLLEDWISFETQENRRLVLIGSDITKGIVPVTREEREWRDLTGRCYQQISTKADRVDLIWYGLNQQLKS